jgi:hypothetical protein
MNLKKNALIRHFRVMLEVVPFVAEWEGSYIRQSTWMAWMDCPLWLIDVTVFCIYSAAFSGWFYDIICLMTLYRSTIGKGCLYRHRSY